jgi:RimJ/RimL family protein N-acetyltransferase
MNESFVLTSSECDITLRAITEGDLENLRVWKNAHRFAFFYQEIITPDQQHKWFQGYLTRAHDYMFIVECENEPIGCMGFRLIEQYADIYNVIRARADLGKGAMSQTLRLLCSFIATDFTRDIRARVLLTNPARAWYRTNAFTEIAQYDTYVEMQLDWSRFQVCSFQKIQARR